MFFLTGGFWVYVGCVLGMADICWLCHRRLRQIAIREGIPNHWTVRALAIAYVALTLAIAVAGWLIVSHGMHV